MLSKLHTHVEAPGDVIEHICLCLQYMRMYIWKMSPGCGEAELQCCFLWRRKTKTLG